MEDMRIRELDESCQSIAETRAEINNLKELEASFEITALGQMRRHDKSTWAHAGVTLVRVPGEEKLQVKTTRQRTATAQNGDDADDDGAGETPEPDFDTDADGAVTDDAGEEKE